MDPGAPEPTLAGLGDLLRSGQERRDSELAAASDVRRWVTAPVLGGRCHRPAPWVAAKRAVRAAGVPAGLGLRPFSI